MKKADKFDPGKWLVENKITTQSKLNENKEGIFDVNNLSQIFKEAVKKGLISSEDAKYNIKLMKKLPLILKSEDDDEIFDFISDLESISTFDEDEADGKWAEFNDQLSSFSYVSDLDELEDAYSKFTEFVSTF